MFSVIPLKFSLLLWLFHFQLGHFIPYFTIRVLYIYYQQYYLRTSRELRRLDSVSRSPIFANFQESLTEFRQLELMVKKNDSNF